MASGDCAHVFCVRFVDFTVCGDKPDTRTTLAYYVFVGNSSMEIQQTLFPNRMGTLLEPKISSEQELVVSVCRVGLGVHSPRVCGGIYVVNCVLIVSGNVSKIIHTIANRPGYRMFCN